MPKKKKIAKHLQKSFKHSLLTTELTTGLNGILVNRGNWSEESQRTYNCLEVYTDRGYRCRYCREKAVFTAKEQQYAYEVKKRHIDQTRVLCPACFHTMHTKRDVIQAIEKRWQAEKNQLQNDVEFLRDWREKLIDFQGYTNKWNNTITSLQKRIEKLEEKEEKNND
ncbi:MAG: zinc-ribbon domain containing protein [Gammaproteobacteria bacterium]|nr:zinc-ribbon domain containing protein [Gammaproteobacteria bacterium]